MTHAEDPTKQRNETSVKKTVSRETSNIPNAPVVYKFPARELLCDSS